MNSKLTEEAAQRLYTDRDEFINMLQTLKGEHIYQAGFTIATYSKVFDMLNNNVFNCEYLSDLILCNESPIVNNLTVDYVMADNKDFTNLESFVKSKVDELYPR